MRTQSYGYTPDPMQYGEGRAGEIARTDGVELVNLYHLARTALADKPYAEQGRWHRMKWAAHWYAKEHEGVSETLAYKALDRVLGG